MRGQTAADKDDKYWQEYWRFRTAHFPDTKSAQDCYEDTVQVFTETAKWLDIGCGHALLHHWRIEKSREFARKARILVGIDYDQSSIVKNFIVTERVVGDSLCLPFRTGFFSLVTCNMVMEHISDPKLFVYEIARVLEPGGVGVVHTPNLLHWQTLVSALTPHWAHEFACRMLENRGPSDVFPTFYRGNTLGRLLRLFRNQGMTRISGGLVRDVPKRYPIPGLSKAFLYLSCFEFKLLSVAVLESFRQNLVVAFRKDA